MDPRERIAELERMVARLEARARLNVATDETLELAVRDRLPLDHALRQLLPLLLAHLDARGALVHTFDESMRLRTFQSGELPIDAATLCATTDEGRPFHAEIGGQTVLGQPLDVAGELFGAAAVAFAEPLSAEARADKVALLDTWCEELDNYLAAIARAREKHRITSELSEALREPVLDVGIARAIDVLKAHVAFDDMLLVFRHEDDLEGASLHYKIIQGGELTHDSRTKGDMDVDDFLRTEAARLVQGEAKALLSHLGITRFREEVLINGVRDERIVGRLVITSTHGEFHTFDRDLVERFADYLRQRVVDFNREWKQLALTFSPDTVRRLLAEEDYRRRFLMPVERDVAVLYCDIAGFTRVSEQVLREPALIGKLVDTWSAEVVRILWESGGVFDKMVGDCIIGLWGPPFHDLSPATQCERAVQAARRIRDYTRTLGDVIPELRDADPPPGVATGLHFCPLYVGYFGPNDDYTGFSSGMNNTARLQGVAGRDEILCMEEFTQAYGDPEAFGEKQYATVKNVAEPLCYRALR